jgi:hypothetical protein
MVCSPIYYFSAPKGKYLDPATSSHPIKAEGYEIRPDFISMVRDFEEICATLMISGMNHDSQVEDLSIFINRMGKSVV